MARRIAVIVAEASLICSLSLAACTDSDSLGESASVRNTEAFEWLMMARLPTADGSLGPEVQVRVIEGSSYAEAIHPPDEPTVVVPRGGDDSIELGAEDDVVVFLDWCELQSRDPNNEIRGGDGHDTLWLPPLNRLPRGGVDFLYSEFEEVHHFETGLHAFSNCSSVADPSFVSRVAGVYGMYDTDNKSDRTQWLSNELDLGGADFPGFGVVAENNTRLIFDYARAVHQSDLDDIENDGLGGASEDWLPGDDNPEVLTHESTPNGTTVLSTPGDDVEFAEAVVGGSDERVPLSNVNFPRSSVGRQHSAWPGILGGGTTSFFSGPNTVITAAHVIYDKGLGGFAPEIGFVPGGTPSTSPHGSFDYDVVWVDRDFFSEDPNTEFFSFGDIAIGFVAAHHRNTWSGPWMGWAVKKGSNFKNNYHFWSRGYPSCNEIGNEIQAICMQENGCTGTPSNCSANQKLFGPEAAYSCTWTGNSGYDDDSGMTRLVKHKCDTTRGNSGGPIYTYHQGSYYVQSVHHGVKPGQAGTWNWARRLTPATISELDYMQARMYQ